jgi:hypothetical protein
MTQEISNLTSEKPTRKKVSAAGKKRQAEAGIRNLEAWYSANAEDDPITKQVDTFRDNIFRELGENPSMTRTALAESCVMNYAAILRLTRELRKLRLHNRMKIIERSSSASGRLVNLLKQLNLDAKPNTQFVPWGPSSKVTAESSNHVLSTGKSSGNRQEQPIKAGVE